VDYESRDYEETLTDLQGLIGRPIGASVLILDENGDPRAEALGFRSRFVRLDDRSIIGHERFTAVFEDRVHFSFTREDFTEGRRFLEDEATSWELRIGQRGWAISLTVAISPLLDDLA
jgi:hypothetical protein